MRCFLNPCPKRVPLASLFVAALLLPAGVTASAAQDIKPDDKELTLADAFKNGKGQMNLRHRYETVSDDNFAQDAEASTLRATLSYRSEPYKGFGIFVEAETVTAVGGKDRYNNKGAEGLFNGVSDRPVVADPAITEINQAVLSFGLGETQLRFGRQELLVSNVRFVGNVGWRQNHQSFDSLSLVNRSVPRTVASYHYIDRINRIFGDEKDLQGHVLDLSINLPSALAVNVYGLQLDYDDASTSALSTSTVGLRLHGEPRLGARGKFIYTSEFASQRDAGNNPNRVAANYYVGELGLGSKAFTVIAGLEVLEGSPVDGKFTTPLATLHKFNGWADKFLATPTNGLEDFYLTMKGKAGSFGWAATFHDFAANTGRLDYGTELDVSLSYSTKWGQAFGVKAARYDADAFSADTDKVMLFTGYSLGG